MDVMKMIKDQEITFTIYYKEQPPEQPQKKKIPTWLIIVLIMLGIGAFIRGRNR